MRKNSIKNTRINGEVQKELSRIIRSEVKDPRIHPMTSVLRAVVAPDLKSCKAYISVLGNEEAVKETLAGLRAAEGYIRRELAHGLNLRNTPEITFLADGSIAYGVSMSHRIDEVIQADLRSAELRGEESEEQAEEEISLNSISRGEDEDELC